MTSIIFLTLGFALKGGYIISDCFSSEAISNKSKAVVANFQQIIFVSILPLKYFVDKMIDGNYLVNVMVDPGQEPETYSPVPKKMQQLSKAHYYFHFGFPFEVVLAKKIKTINPGLIVVDLRREILADKVQDQDRVQDQGQDQNHQDQEDDPHIWSNPRLMIKVVDVISSKLLKNTSGNNASASQTLQKEIATNAHRLKGQLQALDLNLKQMFSKLSGHYFLVYHPAWSYFASEYGLKQLSIEHHGKSPGPQDLVNLTKKVRDQKIKVIFIQKQQGKKQVATIADTLGVKVMELDPYAYDYILNMSETAMTIAKTMREL